MTVPAIPGFIGDPILPPPTPRLVVPAGTTQADAAGLGYGLNLVDTHAGTGKIRLPSAVAGASVGVCIVDSDGASLTLPMVYAAVGSDTINGFPNATAMDLLNNFTVFGCVTDGAWLGSVVDD